MPALALPVVLALVAWWFSTGLILALQHLPRRTHAWSFGGATLVLAGALWTIGRSADDTTEAGAYAGFLAALAVWGWQEMAYYMGFVSGPRPVACPPAARGLDRFLSALATSLWHEFAILAGGLVILCLVWGAPNRVGLWTYAVLVLMNASARLNLFLGVRNLQLEFLPAHLGYLAGYLRQRAMNGLFPLSVSLGTAAAVLLGAAALGAGTEPERTGLALVATLTALAVLEHWFLMLPLPAAALWRWSLPEADKPTAAGAGPAGEGA